MPYAKWEDVNAAIRGLKPRVSLAMANHIADMADGIEAAGTADNPWAAAMATFKREYKVMGGRWVKRRQAEAVSMANKLQRDLLYAYETEQLAEAKTKAVGGRRMKAEDFLVVEDPEKPTTWHLPVKVNGKPNRRLAAGAWAALFDPQGYRGQKYGGPDPAKAKSALKALYKAQEWELPEVAADATPNLAEDGTWYPQADSGGVDWAEVPSVPWGAKSFADVSAAMQSRKATERLHAITYQFGELARNIMGDQDEPDKLGALQALADEFLAIAGEVISGVASGEPMMEYDEEPAHAAKLGETHAGAILAWKDLAEAGTPGAAVPMTMDVQLIEPGFGNTKDNNFYPREMLARDAKVFVGAKMYETDHRAAEKSNRTWVSTVKAIKGFTSTGAPVAEVVVHDPGFAERARALRDANLLEQMACSILAGGMARKGKVDGRPANVVEEITESMAVDWVTRAGAGGHAMSLAESAEKGDPMSKRIATVRLTGGKELADPEALKTKLGGLAVELFGEGAEIEAVQLAEVGQEPPPEPAPKPPEPEPTHLAEAEVKAAIEKTSLPEPAKARLSAAKYADAPALEAAVTAEVAYLKAVTGSGKPFGQGATSTGEPHMTPEQYEAGFVKIGEKYGVPMAAPAK